MRNVRVYYEIRKIDQYNIYILSNELEWTNLGCVEGGGGETLPIRTMQGMCLISENTRSCK